MTFSKGKYFVSEDSSVTKCDTRLNAYIWKFIFNVYGKCVMGRLPKFFFVWFLVLFFIPYSGFAFELENTADNPRLVNLTPQQFRALDTIEKRIYNNSFYNENTIDRIERLELDLFHEIRKGTPTQRINTLRIESTKIALRGTAMTPMMQDTFNTRYINPRGEDAPAYYDDVGIIDGLIRVWWPDFYDKISEYRKYKEANFF